MRGVVQLTVCVVRAQDVQLQGAGAVQAFVREMNGAVTAQLDGFKSRVFKMNRAEPQARHLYVTEWSELSAATAEASLELLLMGASALVGEPGTRLDGRWVIKAGRRFSSLALTLLDGSASHRDLVIVEGALGLMSRVAHASGSESISPMLWLLTAGAQPLAATPRALARPECAGVWGAARSARAEAPAACIGCIDVPAPRAGWSQWVRSLSTGATSPLEPERWCGKIHMRVPRLAHATVTVSGLIRLHLHARGAITNLAIEPQASFSEAGLLEAAEVELRVIAVGLNFRDVLNVLGQYPGDPGPPGGDCSGTVSAVGVISRT